MDSSKIKNSKESLNFNQFLQYSTHRMYSLDAEI